MTTDTRRRVKLYALNADRQWDDRGTGHVSSNYVERLKGEFCHKFRIFVVIRNGLDEENCAGISLLVRAEADGSLLLESKIQPDTAYQKQQDTLIVWSEGDNFDLALSFQEKAGCDEIWEKICHVSVSTTHNPLSHIRKFEINFLSSSSFPPSSMSIGSRQRSIGRHNARHRRRVRR